MKSRIRRIRKMDKTRSTSSKAAFILTLAVLLAAEGMGMTAMAAAPAGKQVRGIKYRDNISWESIMAEEIEKESSRVPGTPTGEQPEGMREMPGAAGEQPASAARLQEMENTVWGKPVSRVPLVTWESISAEVRQEQLRAAAQKISAAGTGQGKLQGVEAGVLGVQRNLPGAARTGDETRLLLGGLLLILSIAAMGGISISWKRGGK